MSVPRVSRTKPVRSPSVAAAVTVAVRSRPPGTVTVGATTIAAPVAVPAGSTATSQTPAPPPASARFTWTGTVAPGGMRPNETEAGDASTSGTSALSGFASPPPARIGVAAWSPSLTARARLDQRGLELGHRPGGVPLDQQGRGAGDLRRRHRRPRHRLPVAAGHRGQDRDAGRADVGLEPQRQWCRAGGAEVGELAAARRIGARDGGDGDRPVRGAGRDQRSPAELLEVVPRRHDRHDPGRRGSVERARDDVARRLDLRLAEREVDHVHAVRRQRPRSRRRSPARCRRGRRSRRSGRSAPCSCRCRPGARCRRP